MSAAAINKPCIQSASEGLSKFIPWPEGGPLLGDAPSATKQAGSHSLYNASSTFHSFVWRTEFNHTMLGPKLQWCTKTDGTLKDA